MGADRALLVVALQTLLMGGVRNYGEDEVVAQQTPRALASAAALDYVLMLATETAGVRIAHDDAERAIHEGFIRAVDDGMRLIRAVAGTGDPDAIAFAREALRTFRAAMDAENINDDERRFTLIALAADISKD
jgi:hypothetical protein